MSNLFENNGAEFSEDRKYRYALWRIWDKKLPLVMFIGLNPSTAAEDKNDPTIRRVISMAKGWGYGGVYMMNCFPFVSTDPNMMALTPHDEDNKNDKWLLDTARSCEMVVFAWGNFDVVKTLGKDEQMNFLFPHAMCLIKNKNGSPRHPLYVPSSVTPIIFKTSLNY